MFRQELSEEVSDTPSQKSTNATVEDALDVFEIKEKQIIDVKMKQTNTLRETAN